MPSSVRFQMDQIAEALERLGVVLSVSDRDLESKISFRPNILGAYSTALSNRFLMENVLELMRQELIDEILKEMRLDKRTKRLADGISGEEIQEKRGGNWKDVPKPSVSNQTRVVRSRTISGSGSPITLEILDRGEGEFALVVQLNHPLYIVMHSGARPHMVPPRNHIHVFPSRELIAQDARAALSRYGPKFFDLRPVPWRDKNSPRYYQERYRSTYTDRWLYKWRAKPLKLFTRDPIPGAAIAKNLFLQRAWRRVIARARRRLPQTITARMRGRGIAT